MFELSVESSVVLKAAVRSGRTSSLDCFPFVWVICILYARHCEYLANAESARQVNETVGNVKTIRCKMHFLHGWVSDRPVLFPLHDKLSRDESSRRGRIQDLAVVTGAGSGIGRAIVLQLASCGVPCCLVGRVNCRMSPI
jgi:hypothetical protein